MTAEIVNLRRARKAKRRDEDGRIAQNNRAAFGRTKAELQASAREAEASNLRLDGARRERREPAADD